MTPLLLILTSFVDTQLVFTKSFPHSNPEYFAITIDRSGAGEFKTAPNDPMPVKFQLTEAEVSALYSLAERVNLSENLESKAKVANMGKKTIRYVKDAGSAEQTFNYTENLDARTLTDWFERISETEMRYIDLERAAKYDKIGVNQALLGLQVSWERKRLVAASQFIPLLDRITKGESYLQMARNRAAALASTFRGTP
jgi:hypothetical protein